MLAPSGQYSVVRLGKNFGKGEVPQVVVPANVYQAAICLGQKYSLCGCTVVPGFDFANFVMPSREELTSLFPLYKQVITQFTRK